MSGSTIAVLLMTITLGFINGQELPPPGNVSNKTGVFKESIIRSAKYCSSVYETSTVKVLALMMSEESDDQNGKCFLHCMLQRYRLMDSNGSFNQAKFSPFLEYIPDSTFLRSIRSNLDTCLKERSSGSSCDKAFKFVKCFYANARTQNETEGAKSSVSAVNF